MAPICPKVSPCSPVPSFADTSETFLPLVSTSPSSYLLCDWHRLWKQHTTPVISLLFILGPHIRIGLLGSGPACLLCPIFSLQSTCFDSSWVSSSCLLRGTVSLSSLQKCPSRPGYSITGLIVCVSLLGSADTTLDKQLNIQFSAHSLPSPQKAPESRVFFVS